MLIEQPYTDQGDAQVTCGLQKISGNYTETSRIYRQRLTQAEFHAEVSHGSQRVVAIELVEPGRLTQVRFSIGELALELIDKRGICSQCFQPLPRAAFQDQPRIVRGFPKFWIDFLPEDIGAMIPVPTQIERQVCQPFKF